MTNTLIYRYCYYCESHRHILVPDDLQVLENLGFQLTIEQNLGALLGLCAGYLGLAYFALWFAVRGVSS